MDSLLQAAARIMRPGAVQHEAFLFAGTVILAALFFTVGGIFMKLSDGLTKFWPTMIVFALFVTGAGLQTLAMKREDLAVTGGTGSHSCVSVRRPGVQRELQSCTNRRCIAYRAWYHLVAFSLLTHNSSCVREMFAVARSQGLQPADMQQHSCNGDGGRGTRIWGLYR